MTVQRVAIVAFNRIRPFHLSVPCAVFGESSGGEPLFDVRVCAAEAGVLQSHAGFTIGTRYRLGELARAQIVVVPTWRDPQEVPPAPLLAALRRAHDAPDEDVEQDHEGGLERDEEGLDGHP